ncbi:MAG: threonylcarbamoyl-AMP synthase [Lachnospiraceae bacterium]|nr:threonylcarbamoyl-AMP synthase [Lachnospiraceae bacterium]
MESNKVSDFREDNYIDTQFLAGNEKENIKAASRILQNNGLVAFPTETVYGLGGNALEPNAAAKIYAAKGRPSDNPLIVHIADTKSVYELAKEVPEKAKLLMEAFWPGPLTIILPKKELVPDGTTGGLNTVAIRMPSHPVALDLIRESGLYIAAPSANTSGRPSPTLAEHVMEDMNGRIEMILDGGAVGIGIESTIVDLTGDVPVILRPGFITKSMLEEIVGEVTIDPALIEPDPNLRPKAPGMKYTHYAPKGELTIVEGEAFDNSGITCTEGNKKDNNYMVDANSTSKIVRKINALVDEKKAAGFKVAVITTSENSDKYNCDHVLIAGDRAQGETIAARLYQVLRKCDELRVDYIFSEAFNEGELGGAIMNRLLKAAGHRVIKV